jgi:hypothetical protein
MMSCPYCGRRATTKIVSWPDEVCLEHALEFWTGLLAYAREQSDVLRASSLRATAAEAVGPSPRDHEDFSIGLAS